MRDKNTFWSSAAKDGLLLGGISVAYVLIIFLMGKIQGGVGITFIMNVLSSLLWIAKFSGSLLFLRFCIHRWQSGSEDEEGRGSRYGAAVALLSALVYSGFHFAYITFVTPDAFVESIDILAQTGALDAKSLELMKEMAPSMPLYSFIGNLIYCTLFGIIASAIFSRPKQNPF